MPQEAEKDNIRHYTAYNTTADRQMMSSLNSSLLLGLTVRVRTKRGEADEIPSPLALAHRGALAKGEHGRADETTDNDT